jgi:hypothetical protein
LLKQRVIVRFIYCCALAAAVDVQVAALEGHILRLLADYEMVAVTAGWQAEADAAAALQQAQEHLAAVERVTYVLHGCGVPA